MLLIECEIFNVYISNIKSEIDLKKNFTELFSLACHLHLKKESGKYEKELSVLSLKSNVMLSEFEVIINNMNKNNKKD